MKPWEERLRALCFEEYGETPFGVDPASTVRCASEHIAKVREEFNIPLADSTLKKRIAAYRREARSVQMDAILGKAVHALKLLNADGLEDDIDYLMEKLRGDYHGMACLARVFVAVGRLHEQMAHRKGLVAIGGEG